MGSKRIPFVYKLFLFLFLILGISSLVLPYTFPWERTPINETNNSPKPTFKGNISPLPSPNFPKSTFPTINSKLTEELDNYLLEIAYYTQFQVDETQKKYVYEYLLSTPIYHLPSASTAQNRKIFDGKRKSLIALWEEHYQRKWPQYKENLIENGKTLRNKGQNFDAHHIIELSWNGPNLWWNLTPAMYGSQHQNGIHKPGTLASTIFSRE